jgi:hypothetical protein
MGLSLARSLTAIGFLVYSTLNRIRFLPVENAVCLGLGPGRQTEQAVLDPAKEQRNGGH